jgi:LytS/YehU family sensor histidine kinase
MMRIVSAVSAAMFALAGFVIIYVDMQLPKHARGGKVWTVVAGIGSAFFLTLALLEESFLLNFGLPLALRMMAVGLALYVMHRFGMLSWLLNNARNFKGMTTVIAVFSVICVFGTVAGIEYQGLVINFRDLGAMMAGLLGGPFAGLAVGLIGGAYRYGLGGWTATACFAATVSAGFMSGLLSWYWKGRIDYRKAVFTGVLAESMHLFFFLPLLQQGGTTELVLETIRELFLPMTVVNVLGLIILVYIMESDRGKRKSQSP